MQVYGIHHFPSAVAPIVVTLRQLLTHLPGRLVGPDVEVSGVRHDSRTVVPGDLFAAIAGFQQDGAVFLEDAIRRGAVALLTEVQRDTPLPQLIVPNARRALALASELAYGAPSRNLGVVGVTGTNGKTTTTFLLEAIARAAGGKPGVMGTVNFRCGEDVFETPHTTAEADDIARHARRWCDQGASHLFLEVSSHALELHRVDGLDFDVATFTNITRDHLDFHGSMDAYRDAKARLFDELAPTHAVINVDDPFGRELAARASGVLRYSCAGPADIHPLSARVDGQGIRAHVKSPWGSINLESPLIGHHNLANLLGAIGCALALEIPPATIERALRTCHGAPGRLDSVEHPRGAGVYVDYAHTPDALGNVLRCLRPLTEGRLFVVFGCGGERDRGKRAMMGQVAAAHADLAILTSDNPRSERPRAILDAIALGARNSMADLRVHDLFAATRGMVVIEDRAEAIARAMEAARSGDVVLIAGKGHEREQEFADRVVPFDDANVARAACRR
ncbi:MAG: UDP-N-acetylmuramoyl-L-alanyl-D-glutamate--2,6-diaminopimelate ligase [Myxococcota bacterium]